MMSYTTTGSGFDIQGDGALRVASVQQVANVGDTVLDLQAGQNAGVRSNIGVLSGAHSREQLEREPAPHHLLLSVAELPALWAP